MKYIRDFQYSVEPDDINNLLDECKKTYPEYADEETARLLFSLMDLTTLSEKDNSENVSRMCDQVNLLNESYPDLHAPAAICVYPELVAIVKEKLNNPLVNIASVGGGFPASQTFLEVKLKEVEMAIAAGADEIDIVLSVGKFQNEQIEDVFQEISAIKELMGSLHLKVILETSSLDDFHEVRKASMLAMAAGADFIKTSTGKASSGASPDSFAVMCLSIKEFYDNTGKKIGIKPAGGISTTESAYTYLGIVRHVLGEDWLNQEKFRIGASRLANHLIRAIYKKEEGFSYFH